jgi:two-component system NtrC family sensor kinase
MMLLSRSGSGEKTTINVNRSIDEYLNIAINGFKGKVNAFECKLEKVVDTKLPTIKIVSEDFGSVLLNIFSNAFYTMNEKRKKISSIANSSSIINYEPQLIVKTDLINSAIVITISDNGLGIPEEILGKIFLPFFTTKPTGEGTGLGLSISHDIITKGNNGELAVKSEIGKGSEFKITLPLKVID